MEVRGAFGGRAGVVALIGGPSTLRQAQDNAGSGPAAKPVLIVATTDAARTLGAKAGALVAAGAAALGGRGGGRDDLAQGGGTQVDAAPKALADIRAALAG
jgi:alanyl-tRNA synthetase